MFMCSITKCVLLSYDLLCNMAQSVTKLRNKNKNRKKWLQNQAKQFFSVILFLIQPSKSRIEKSLLFFLLAKTIRIGLIALNKIMIFYLLNLSLVYTQNI